MGDQIFGGTGTLGHLFVVDPASGSSTDLGVAVEGQTKVSSLVLGHDGNVYGGTGTWSDPAHLFRFDPADPAVEDLGALSAPSSEVAGLAVGDDGRIYGGMASIQSLFAYDPALGKLWMIGDVPGIAGISCLTAGPGNILYGGDYPGGQFWAFDPGSGTGGALGKPLQDETGIWAVVAGPDGRIYGGTGSARGALFRYEAESKTFAVFGAPVWLDTYLYSLVLGSDGQIYGGTGYRRGKVFRFDPVGHPYATPGTATSISISPRMKEKTWVPGIAEVWALAVASDGWLYASGYGVGGATKLSRWNPAVGGEMEIVGQVPGIPSVVYDLLEGPDGKIYGGGGSYASAPTLFSYDPASDSFAYLPLGLVEDSYVNALVRCRDGLIYGGTGGSGGVENGQVFAYDPAGGSFTYFGQALPGETSVESLACAPDGTLYGGTGPAGHLFRLDPGTPPQSPPLDSRRSPQARQWGWGFTDLGQPVPGETYISALAWGADGRLYGGTLENGHLFAYDPASGAVADWGRPFALDAEVHHLEAGADGMVYGVTGGSEGHLFRYDTASLTLSDLGRAVPYERHAYGLALDPARQTVYLGTGYNYGMLVAYEGGYKFGWLRLEYGASTPPATGLSVDVLGTAGDVWLPGAASGASLLGIPVAEAPALQLRANLSTGDPGATPALLEWSVTWTADPVMAISPPGLSFVAQAGGPDPQAQSLEVENTSGGELVWSLAGLPAWLAAEPLTGTAPSTVTAAAHVEGLAAGVYTATLVFEGDACANCPVQVPVELTVLEQSYTVHLPLVMRVSPGH